MFSKSLLLLLSISLNSYSIGFDGEPTVEKELLFVFFLSFGD